MADLPINNGRQPTFNELLIKEVRRHPELYDQQHRVCTDNGERNVLWEAIANGIDEAITGEFAKKRWLQMRDRYRKELKMSMKSLTRPKWPYFEKLSWLDPFLKDTKKESLTPPSFLSASSLGISSSDSSTASSQENMLLMDPSFDFPSFQQQGGGYPPSSMSALLEGILAATARINTTTAGVVASVDSPNRHRTATTSESQEDMSTTAFDCSPDSAVASAGSEDGEKQQNQGPLVEEGNHQSTTTTMMKMLSTTRSINREDGSGGGRLRQHHHTNKNPPYLVRRGGSLKMDTVQIKPLSSLTDPSPPPSMVAVAELAATHAMSMNMNNNRSPSNGAMDQPAEQAAVQRVSLNCLKKSLSTAFSQSSSAAIPPPMATDPIEVDGLGIFARPSEWIDDEDLLFSRLLVVRLKKLDPKDRRAIRAKIHEWLDEKEEQMEVR